MRVISEFRDYYDVVQAQGQDQSLLYVRKERTVVIKNEDFPFPYMLHYGGMYWGFRRLISPIMRQYIIGLCGKIYPVIHLSSSRDNNKAWCHKLEDVDVFIEANFKKKEVAEYYLPHNSRKVTVKVWDSSVRRYLFDKFFKECEAKKEAFQEMFIQERCPIIVGAWRSARSKDTKIVYNACLKDYEFFRVIEPYTAFQEIAMFMGNLAVPLKEIPKIPDLVMVSAKGFDEFSFRKQPKE